MDIQSFLHNNHVFSLAMVRSQLGEDSSLDDLLEQAIGAGDAELVAGEVYVSRVGQFSFLEPDPLAVAAAFGPDVTIAYRSALDLHGFPVGPWNRVQFTTSLQLDTFAYRGFTYEPHPLSQTLRESEEGLFTTPVRRAEDMIRASTRERAVVDVLNHIDACGGLDEVFRSLASTPFVDSSIVLAYLAVLQDPAAAARAGWVLEQQPRDWYITDEDVARIRDMLGEGPYYLTGPDDAERQIAEWRLYVPGEPPQIEAWLHE